MLLHGLKTLDGVADPRVDALDFLRAPVPPAPPVAPPPPSPPAPPGVGGGVTLRGVTPRSSSSSPRSLERDEAAAPSGICAAKRDDVQTALQKLFEIKLKSEIKKKIIFFK